MKTDFSRRNLPRISPRSLLLLWPGLFLCTAFALPLGAILLRVLETGKETSAFLISPYYRHLLGFTLKQAAISTLCAIIFGLPGAWFLGCCQFPGRRLLKSLSTVPFVLPPILAVLGFVLIFGNAGLVNSIRQLLSGADAPAWKMLYGLPGIVLAHVFYNFTITARIVGDAWSRLPLLERKAAQSLGANRWRAFLAADLPRLMPAIITAGIIIFLYCFMSFAVVLVLGGGLRYATLEVEIYRLAKRLDFARGSSLAALESIFAFLLLLIYAVADAKMRLRTPDNTRNTLLRAPHKLTGPHRLAAVTYLLIALVLILLPMAAVVLNSFLARTTRSAALGFSLIHWQRLFGTIGPAGNAVSSLPIMALLRSMGLAAAAAVLSSSAATASAWYVARNGRGKRIIETVLALPLGVSSIVLGLGWLLLLRSMPHDGLPRLAALAAAHSLTSLPFCYRIINGRLKQISTRVIQAARTAGANTAKTFFLIEVPMSRQALTTSAVFAFALSIGELNATAILAPSSFTTAPLAMYRMVGTYNFGGACALGTLLIILCAAAFFLLDLAPISIVRNPE